MAGMMNKVEVHIEVRPQSPAPFPDVLGRYRRNVDMWRAGPGLACACVIKDVGWGEEGSEGVSSLHCCGFSAFSWLPGYLDITLPSPVFIAGLSPPLRPSVNEEQATHLADSGWVGRSPA